ncbi:riboflavin synthase [Myxococcaceae bacterium]|nr:riboflavin synthase [Myxococcaceae bacterium]
MFTGIVEAMGEISRIERSSDLARLVVDAGVAAEGAKLGDSIAVNGCCLTVTAIDDLRLSFEAVAETLARTNLGMLTPGSRVNLERSVLAGQRLDGHVVQGHIDATGEVVSLERNGDDVRLEVRCGRDFSDLLVDKGSVAIDGVSLTVVRAGRDGFDVALIPHTLAVTTLGRRRPGDRVNLEADVLGKYVKKYVERVLAGVPANDRRPAT